MPNQQRNTAMMLPWCWKVYVGKVIYLAKGVDVCPAKRA